MFSLDQKIVYPGHGVAQITRIIERNVAGKDCSFFELSFLNKDMTILVPVQNASAVGLRVLSSGERIEAAIKNLSDMSSISFPDNIANWNKRNKGYKALIQRGTLDDICAIYKELRLIQQQKELSFGEKSILQQAENLIVEEVSIVQASEPAQSRDAVRTITGIAKQKIPAEVVSNM